MEDKYIDLIINKCIAPNKKSLFLAYKKEIIPFIEKLKTKLRNLGIEDIYEEIEDQEEVHDILKNIDIKEIKNHPHFNKRKWDEYAKKDAAFLMFTTEGKDIMKDIDPEKIKEMAKVAQITKPLYRKLQNQCKLSWAIAAYPSVEWAKDIYHNREDSYEQLKNAIFKMCMLDEVNPIKSWDKQIAKNKKVANYLNNLKIESLHYQNAKGTDLTVYLPENYIFESAEDNNIMVNMPSYEIFTSPIYNKTEGIVYASMPLIYNGNTIKDFYLEFKEGKVINFDAKEGREILQGIIEIDNNSCYLGECAIVEASSPIARMNTIFKTTLIDENASCHLALGSGFSECISGGLDMTKEDLLKNGINTSDTHVDFMIGTEDLSITATLKDKTKITILKDGNFDEDLLSKIEE